MPISHEWLVEDRVILTTMLDVVTENEIEEWLQNQQEMVAKGTPLVHHISDGLQLEKMDVNLKTFYKMITAIPRTKNFGWHIEVTTSPISKVTSSIVSRFAGVHTRTYPTVEQAVKFLREKDETLQNKTWQKV